MTANTDDFEITLLGRGGHGAHPDQTIDPIVMAAQVVNAFQTIVSRCTDPLSPAVVTIGKIQSGSARNIIPSSASLAGTVRTLHDESKEVVFRSMKQIVNSIANMYEAPPPSLEIIPGCPAVVNDTASSELIQHVADEIIGRSSVIDEPSMGGEDFAYYLQRVPGAMFRLGVVSQDETSNASLHSDKFNFNDNALRSGMLMLSGIALEFLSR
jgi:amidohydrolase